MASAVEILAHRVVWSLVVVLALLSVQRRVRVLGALVRRRRAAVLLTLAAVVIGINWGTYIYGVNSEQVVETSLGYFVNPLVTVLLGVVVLGERLRPAQWAAVGVAAVAVVVLAAGYGRPPWIALTLAFSFGSYGLLKKKADVGAVEGLAVETAVLFLPALALLVVLEVSGEGSLGGQGVAHPLLMAGSGVVTAIPLLCFGAAATRVPLTTLGLLQYLAPTMQFLLGVVLFDEAMPAERLVGFSLVWVALAIFTTDTVANARRQLQLTTAAVT